MSWSSRCHQLDVTQFRPANRILLRQRPRAMRRLQHCSSALRSWPCVLRQCVFSGSRQRALLWSPRALDPATGQLQWEFRHPSPSWSGVLSTAGNLVFTGDAEGNFIALDATSGKALWHFQTGGSVYSAPISFALDGKQYVAIAAGSALHTFGFPDLWRLTADSELTAEESSISDCRNS